VTAEKEKLTHTLEETEKTLQRLDLDAANTATLICSSMDELRALIDQREKELLEALEQRWEAEEKKFLLQKEELEFFLDSITHSIEYASHLLDHGSQVDLASTSPAVLSRLSTILYSPPSCLSTIDGPLFSFTEAPSLSLPHEIPFDLRTVISSAGKIVSAVHSSHYSGLMTEPAPSQAERERYERLRADGRELEAVHRRFDQAKSQYTKNKQKYNKELQALKVQVSELEEEKQALNLANSQLKNMVRELEEKLSAEEPFRRYVKRDNGRVEEENLELKNTILNLANEAEDEVKEQLALLKLQWGTKRDLRSVRNAAKIAGPDNLPSPFNNPSCLAIDHHQRIFIADTGNTRIQVLVENEFSTFKCRSRTGKTRFRGPEGVTFDPKNKRILVTDSPSNKVLVYDLAGNYRFSFGSGGEDEGEFDNPVGLTVDQQANIYVADRDNHRVQIFDKDFNFISEFGTLGEDFGELNSPYDVAVLSNGDVIVSDTNGRLSKFDPDGDFIEAIGETYLSNPLGLFVDSEDNILVADWDLHSVFIFDQFGQLRKQIGHGILLHPSGVVMNSKGEIYVSAQTSNDDYELFIF